MRVCNSKQLQWYLSLWFDGNNLHWETQRVSVSVIMLLNLYNQRVKALTPRPHARCATVRELLVVSPTVLTLHSHNQLLGGHSMNRGTKIIWKIVKSIWPSASY